MKTQSFRVLIIDDMPINRIVLSSLLASHGVMSDQAESGMECLTLCEEKDYDLILLDHRMPDMDGIDTLVRLKEIFAERGKEIPVICHTAEEGRKNINLYKAAGFADVLIKPIDPKELFDVLMTYLPLTESDESHREEEKADELAFFSEELSNSDIDPSEADELEKLPMWIKLVPHLDLVAGVTSCGSAEDYMDALYIFYSSIEEKADEIDNFLTNEDDTMYGLRIHSLKSMARLVGAKKLGATAALLEDAAHKKDISFIRKNTPGFLRDYRRFLDLLAPLEEEKPVSQEIPTISKTPISVTTEGFCGRSVLFIQSGQGIVNKGIEKNLQTADFKVTSIPDEPDKIIAHRNDANIIIYYPRIVDDSHIGVTMNLLGEICQDDTKILCLTGDMTILKAAMQTNGANRVSRTYPRPVNIERFIDEIEYFYGLEKNYHRKKTLYLVDDDPGYLSVISHWLSPYYNLSCFQSGQEILEGLSALKPDLILLDYAMPDMDGCDVIRHIRRNFPETKIPVIFLTGKNDKDVVFHALEYKPDGYFLKTSQKETLLDVIERFFAETLFRRSLAADQI